MAKRRKGKNSLIDSISTQAAVKQESTELSTISSSNEQLESKTEYENLTEDLATIQDLKDLNPEMAADIKVFASPEFKDSLAHAEEFAALQNAEAAMSELSSANMKLQSENTALQAENDKYLMKISELTFENAKLNAQIQELSKSAGNGNYAPPALNERTIPNSFDIASKKPAQKSPRGVNYPHQSNIGYTSWN